jgi:acyl carrier protein
MGLEMVELVLSLEERFDIAIEDEAWNAIAAGRNPFDLTAGEVCAVVEAKCRLRRRVRENEAEPPVLDYQRKGAWTTDTEDVWAGVRDIIAETIGIKPEQVRPSSWLVRDLGLST